jgi:hypothetical protein
MRARGINYDTGFSPSGHNTRETFEPAQVEHEMRVIADDLHCDAVRISGGDPERISVSARYAVAAGLEVWFSPFPCDMGVDELRPYFAECADRAEELRKDGAPVVLVNGCEISLFANGFFPGETALERIHNVTHGGPELWAVMPEALGRTAAFLSETAELARARFGGRITYASGTWENVDWRAFDLVAVDAYRDANNRDTFRDQVRGLFQHGKPVVVTEFGSCTYRGAADRGGLGWAVVDWDTQTLTEPLVRDEQEQVRYATELLDVFERLGVDTAFWFTFAGYGLPFHEEPLRDLDMASYGVVRITPYSGTPWERKAVFDTLASSNAGNKAARTSTPVSPNAVG